MRRDVLALVGDVHGACSAIEELCAAHEAATDERICGILQIGDLGVFPFPSRADRATKKRGEADLFTPYFEGTARIERPLWFVRGNHEDFVYLDSKRNKSVDAAGMMTLIADGTVHEVHVGSGVVRVAGLGGIEPTRVRPTKAAALEGSRYLDPAEVRALSRLRPGSVDVLLTHDAPLGMGLQGHADVGSERITRLVEHLRPRVHAYGHYGGRRVVPPKVIGHTFTLCLNQPDAVHLPGRDGGFWVLDPADWRPRHPAVTGSARPEGNTQRT